MTVFITGQIVAAGGWVLLHLQENPRVSGGGAPDHHGVAARFLYDTLGVHGRLNIAVANDRNFHGLLDGGDQLPIGAAGVALFARTRVHGDGFDADAFRKLRHLDGDDGVFVPASAQFNGERNAHGGAYRAKNLAEQIKVAEQAGAATFDDFLRGAAEVDVHGVVAEVRSEE